jgi:hypothetical protein
MPPDQGEKMTPQERKLPGGWWRRCCGLAVVALLCPSLLWGQGDQRVPVELQFRLAGGQIKIGQIFVESLRNRLNRAAGFRLSSSALPRLVLRIYAEGIPGDPYMGVITVTRNVAIPWKGGIREIFVDNLVMVGVSAAHAGKDAQDTLEDTQKTIVPKFTAIRGEGN